MISKAPRKCAPHDCTRDGKCHRPHGRQARQSGKSLPRGRRRRRRGLGSRATALVDRCRAVDCTLGTRDVGVVVGAVVVDETQFATAVCAKYPLRCCRLGVLPVGLGSRIAGDHGQSLSPMPAHVRAATFDDAAEMHSRSTHVNRSAMMTRKASSQLSPPPGQSRARSRAHAQSTPSVQPGTEPSGAGPASCVGEGMGAAGGHPSSTAMAEKTSANAALLASRRSPITPPPRRKRTFPTDRQGRRPRRWRNRRARSCRAPTN